MRPTTSLSELALLFFRLGATSFGGPAAHIAMMEEEIVHRRKWLSTEEFLDLLGATHLIPGPNSTEMAIHIGLRQRGFLGLLVAGVSFIIPAVIIVTLIAWIYVHYGQLPEALKILYGIKPVIIAIIALALLRLAKSAIKSKQHFVIGGVSTALAATGTHEILLLFGIGMTMVAGKRFFSEQKGTVFSFIGLGIFIPALAHSFLSGPTPLVRSAVESKSLFLIFLKIGSVLYGSGYVLLAFLRNDLVQRMNWLSEAQLLDAAVVGQFTPGPVFTTATFVGFILQGGWGACLATVGIFLPAFFLVAISGPIVPKIRQSPLAGAFLDGVNVASLALMTVVTFELGRVTFMDSLTVIIAFISIVLLTHFKVNSVWLILLGAFVGSII